MNNYTECQPQPTMLIRGSVSHMLDDLQRPDAVRFNLRILARIANSHYKGEKMLPQELRALAAHLVHHAERCTLSETDQQIIAAYAVATLRECGK